MFKPLHVETLENARAILEKYWKPRPRKAKVSLNEALGRILSEPVLAKVNVPSFDRSTFDGYAVRAIDTHDAKEDSPISLKCMGRLYAGSWPRKMLRAGQCFEIATGALMPKGADAVVPVEYAVAEGGNIHIYRAVAPGENVARRGSDIRKGEKVVRSGKVLTVADIGVLAAAGIDKVEVYAKPRVAVISSGTELLEIGHRYRLGKIYDVNGPALCGAVKTCGAEPVYLGIAKDDPSDITTLVKKGLDLCDLVLFSGGSSMGAGDIAPGVIGNLGKPGILVHGLSIKPGKPTFIALVHEKPIFGLPGYPVSALIVFDQLVAPYLRSLSRLPEKERAKVRAKLVSKILSARGRREFIPVKLVRKGKEFLAKPILKGSGAITSLSLADGYMDIPLGLEIVEKGEMVEVTLLKGSTLG